MDKQIEEIANDLNMHCCSLAEQFCGEMSCNSCITNYLYNAGYRKASEVAEEIFEKLKVDLKGYIGLNYLDELKKKYTEGEG